MEKIENISSIGFKKEKRSEAGDSNSSEASDFGAVFASVAVESEEKNGKKWQDRSDLQGKQLPKEEPDTNRAVEKVAHKSSANSDEIESKNLHSVKIGPKIDIITEGKLPSEDAVLQFAEEQGIDTKSIQKDGNSLHGSQNFADVAKTKMGLGASEVTISKPGLTGKGEFELTDESIVKTAVKENIIFKPANNIKSDPNRISKIGSAGVAKDAATVGLINKVQFTSEVANFAKQVEALRVRASNVEIEVVSRLRKSENTGKIVVLDPIQFNMSKGLLSNAANKVQNLRMPGQLDEFSKFGLSDLSIDETTLNGNREDLGDFRLASADDKARLDEALRRSEQFQQFSQRMGEALGKRLSAQIAQGVWQVQIALRPERLGRVNVELAVKNGEIEALFKAGNSLAREMIVEGFPRLKEVLQQTGMDVANLQLADGTGSKNDEKPTSQETSKHDNSSDKVPDEEVVDIKTVAIASDSNVDILV